MNARSTQALPAPTLSSTGPLSAARRFVLGIPAAAADFDSRGFYGGNPVARRRLEASGRTFLLGYNSVVSAGGTAALADDIQREARELHGFAFEGAAMALALFDLLTPWPSHHVTRFLAGAGAQHTYMVHVGAGWALARLRRSAWPRIGRYDPILRWLVIDGVGFHEGYFHWRDSIRRQRVPGWCRGPAARVFDQGLGRSLWFVHGAEVARIGTEIGQFPPPRRSELWSGVGLAACYAGGADAASLARLRRAAGEFLTQLAQGAAFAAKARQCAGIPADHSELACRILCGRSATEAAAITDRALVDLPPDGEEIGFQVWRRRIAAELARTGLGT